MIIRSSVYLVFLSSHDCVRCTKLCNQSLLTCEHQCQRLCHSDIPDDHGICQKLVEKTVQSCNHKIFIACSTKPTSDKCTYKMPVRLPCGHLSDVTCAIRTSGVFDTVSCSEPCQDILLCTHQCSGSCGGCKTGKLHLPCKEKCGRQLLCTHVSKMPYTRFIATFCFQSCEAPCSTNCPLCVSECETMCRHSKCSFTCGEPCTPCREVGMIKYMKISLFYSIYFSRVRIHVNMKNVLVCVQLHVFESLVNFHV
jgi:hypothetical protein